MTKTKIQKALAISLLLTSLRNDLNHNKQTNKDSRNKIISLSLEIDKTTRALQESISQLNIK